MINNFGKRENSKFNRRRTCKKCERLSKQQYYSKNKDKVKSKQKEYRINNSEKINEDHKIYYENNKERISNNRKKYYLKNKEKLNKNVNDWYNNTEQGQVARFNLHQDRRTLEEKQGDGITKEQWKECMDFFEWRCAYSGEYIGGKESLGIRTMDHVVALANGGDNAIWNLVPMYKNYNSSKKDNDMLDWYKEQQYYDEEKLNKIYAWIEYASSKWKK